MDGEVAASREGEGITATPEQKEFNKNRFEVELEFLQALSNPNYLHALATSAYLTDPCFLNYLEYLEYLRTVEGGVEFVIYPLSLHHLHLLIHSPIFRLALKEQRFIDRMHEEEMWMWGTWRNPSIIPKPEADPVATQPGQPDGVEKETEEADT